uniref:CUB_2 domain-containing protein n=1 Tax=Caenorhabditis tropicalis TaxID=1561998 RepID=A0A1I7U277_9PELO
MKHLFLLFSLVFPVISVDLTCPTTPITSASQKGSFPAAGPSLFPANYKCGIQFQIPVGQVLYFGIQISLDFFTQDNFTIQDSTATVYQFYITDKEFYAPPTFALAQISTVSNTSTYYFTWEYRSIAGYTKIQKPTGSIVPLNWTANTYYEFTSPNDRVAFHTGSFKQTTDLSLPRVYVYDGEDLSAPFVGNLQYFTDKNPVSTGKSLTLVNFYNREVQSYGIANDYSTISGFDDYSFMVMTDIDWFVHELALPGTETAITYYSLNTDMSYLTFLNYLYPNISGQEVRVRALTPTDRQTTTLLSYNPDNTLASLPQQIPSKVFTVVFHQCEVYITVRPLPYTLWSQANPGRLGYIMSPSVWNPNLPVIPQYFTNMTSTSKLKFTFNVPSVVIDEKGAKLRIEVGSADSSPQVIEFNQTTVNTGQTVAHGSYIATSFTGTTSKSSFIMRMI